MDPIPFLTHLARLRHRCGSQLITEAKQFCRRDFPLTGAVHLLDIFSLWSNLSQKVFKSPATVSQTVALPRALLPILSYWRGLYHYHEPKLVGIPVSSLYGAPILCVFMYEVPSVFAYLTPLLHKVKVLLDLAFTDIPDFSIPLSEEKLHVYRRVL